jgi:hypothetical protein
MGEKFSRNRAICLTILLVMPTFLVFTACSSLPDRKTDTELQGRTLSTTFTDEGIKLKYSLLGKLEAIEVYGQAEAWRGNVEALAEADALAKLVKFAYGSSVDTQRRVNIIGKSISSAQDIIHSSKPNSAQISFTDKELETDTSPKKDEKQENAVREAKAVNEATVSTITTITAKGRLVGVRKIKDFQRDDGKTYVAVYQWSEKGTDAADSARKRMLKRSE